MTGPGTGHSSRNHTMNKRRFRGFGMTILFSFRCYLFNTKVALDSNNTFICNLPCILFFSSELLSSQYTKTQVKLKRRLLTLKSLPEKVLRAYLRGVFTNVSTDLGDRYL